MLLRFGHSEKTLKGTVKLPLSKSWLNRYLIIAYLGNFKISLALEDLPDDVRELANALNQVQTDTTINAGHGGTTYRFLTALLAVQSDDFELIGSDRMHERPIGTLVNALRYLGASIDYLGGDGFPPLKIRGKQLQGGQVSITAKESSQFISALMLVAPEMKQGLEIILEGEISSTPYILMTKKMMASFGVDVGWDNSRITIQSGKYQLAAVQPELDWSAVGFFASMLALAERGSELFVEDLKATGFQADENGMAVYKALGVGVKCLENGVRLAKLPATAKQRKTINFNDNPDLAIPFLVVAPFIDTSLFFTGLHTLPLKESDRIVSIKTEMRKFGFDLKNKNDKFWFEGMAKKVSTSPIKIKTYSDHRIAMAFSCLSVLGYVLDIENSNVVSKSFPKYWDVLKGIGFLLS